ncbi:signal peptidase I [Modestobacter sp. NPDC049651]|uniref:signal peptidase I n=1 Tax=unclassified Modestobacter TaxID=2643866 RepID=UPI00340084D1
MTTALLAPHAVATARRLRSSASPAVSGRRVAAWVGRWSVRALVVGALALFALVAVGPHVLHYRTLTMLTGSMTGTIDVGDVAVVTPLPVADVQPGMVISYHIPVDDHRLVTHRVVTVEHGDAGTVTVETKGDANESADPWKATLRGDTAWQVRGVVPHVGTAIQWLRAPVVSQTLVYGVPVLLAGWLLLSIWRPAADETDETPADAEVTR